MHRLESHPDQERKRVQVLLQDQMKQSYILVLGGKNKDLKLNFNFTYLLTTRSAFGVSGQPLSQAKQLQ